MVKNVKKSISLILVLGLILSLTSVNVFAAAPKKEEVKYLGNGKVEVEFYGDVQWSGKTKVKVKDGQGKSYKVSVISKDDDEIKFRVKGYKAGKTYSFKISKVRKEHTKKYGTVKGKFSIPKKSKKNISKATARNIALNDAAKRYGVTSNIYDYDVESDYYKSKSVYDIDFETRSDGVEKEFEYIIQKSNGKILYRHMEIDD